MTSSPVRLAPGDTAPSFSLIDDTSTTVTLDSFRGRRVLLYFYPRANTPGCTTEACDFRDNLARFNDSGIAVVGISPDSPEKLASFRDKYGLTFTLLSDPDKQVMQAYGAFGEKKNYGKVIQGVIRSTFLIDPDGLIESAQYNVRAKGHVDRIVRDLL